MKKKKASKVSRPMRIMEDDYEAQHALDTLVRADEIKGNKGLMKKVKAEATRKKKALDNISKKQGAKKVAPKKKAVAKKATPKRKAVKKKMPY